MKSKALRVMTLCAPFAVQWVGDILLFLQIEFNPLPAQISVFSLSPFRTAWKDDVDDLQRRVAIYKLRSVPVLGSIAAVLQSINERSLRGLQPIPPTLTHRSGEAKSLPRLRAVPCHGGHELDCWPPSLASEAPLGAN
eukprot:2521618-Amphidinium_carterae.2